MKTSRMSILMGVFLLSMGKAGALEVVKTDKGDLNLGGRMQMIGAGEVVKDPVRTDGRVYLFLNQARLTTYGRYLDYKYHVQLSLAGSENTVAPISGGVALTLLDYNVDIPLCPESWLRVGQFKVPYSRERLTDGGYLAFSGRSLNDLGFQLDRDTGFAVFGKHGSLEGTLGVFSGGGREIPQRYLPQKLGFPLTALRFGINKGHDEDIWTLKQTGVKPEKSGYALMGSVVYMKDTIVGHNSVANVRTTADNILLNGNYNPYVAISSSVKADLWQFGADVAFRKPTAMGALGFETEANYGEWSNSRGVYSLIGGRAQASLTGESMGIALRYAALWPDEKTKFNVFSRTGTNPIQEITPSLTFFLKKENAMKLVFDLPVFVGVPVFAEKNVGAYVLPEQVDQITLLSNAANTVKRQTVVTGRALLQFMF